MKTLTYDLINSWDPCYDPIRYIPKDWTGNALDILKLENVSIEDKFWCVFRDEAISDKTLRLFAVWCYRQTLLFVKDPDPRSINAADVAEAYALGNATSEELKVARSAAYAAYFAAESAAYAAYFAARFTAWATKSAKSTWSAARSTAYSAAAQLTKLIEMLEEESK